MALSEFTPAFVSLGAAPYAQLSRTSNPSSRSSRAYIGGADSASPAQPRIANKFCRIASASFCSLFAVAASRSTSRRRVIIARRAEAAAAETAPVEASETDDTAKDKEERTVELGGEQSFTFDVKGTVETMDAFMKENAWEVCIQNVQKVENVPDDSELRVLWLEPNDVGPTRSQMKITAKIEHPKSGRCDVVFVDMESGEVDKKTGEVTFDPERKFPFETLNYLTWETSDDGKLRVTNYNRSKSVIKLPWWFPVPNFMVAKILNFFVSQVAAQGMKKANEQITTRYPQWVSTQA